MAMQTTTDLWAELCREFESQHSSPVGENRPAAIQWFTSTAREMFQARPTRLRDALEIAGDRFQADGNEEEAIRCFAEALENASGVCTNRLRIATKLAMLLEKIPANAVAARDAYRRAVEAAGGDRNNPVVPTLLNNLASLELRLGNFAEATAAYTQAIETASAIYGSQHPETALLQNNLAVAHTSAGNFAIAEGLHLQALAVREANFGANHPDVASSMANLGVVYHDRGEFRKAEKFYRAALAILKHFRDPSDTEVRWIRGNLERLPHISVRTLTETAKM
jgi:tetratricopeptide (TPR) repeat protein